MQLSFFFENDLKMKRPSIFWYLTELPRAIWEWIMSMRFIRKFKPKKSGDGHPIFVIPGFMASGMSTRPMRKMLNRIGYKALDWGLGRNLGKLENMEVLSQKLNNIYQEKNQKITLIGWSLGGVYARELGKQHPEIIKNIITLGSPFNAVDMPNNAWWLFKLVNGKDVKNRYGDWLEQLPNPAPVYTTAVYSKQDGVVPWAGCMEKVEDELHENVEVRGSHFGLGVNKSVLKVIVDRI